MKHTSTLKYSLVLLLGVAQSMAVAGQQSTNRWSVSARSGFNIKADFNYGVSPAAGIPQLTPNGDPFNYDDGYVLTDISGSAGGQTWYWGYDDAAQVVGNEILMSSTTFGGTSGDQEMNGEIPFVGAELLYSRALEFNDDWIFGFDFAISFLPFEFEDRSSFSTETTTTTDRFGFTGGTLPPGAPYQGTFNGPGFLIDAAPSSSSTVVVPGAAVIGRSELNGTLWGLRIGPYMEFPLGENFSVHCSGGLSLGWLDVDVDWRTTGGSAASGSGSDSEMLSGAFLGADILWFFAESWSLTAGAEFEYLNDWEGSFGGNTVRLDFTRSLYATLGISRSF